MKKIKRTYLKKAYLNRIKYTNNFPTQYEQHGFFTECNFGGLIITLDKSGESCIVVRDWGGDEIMISEILEINFYPDPDFTPDPYFLHSDPELIPGFILFPDREPYFLNQFLRY